MPLWHARVDSVVDNVWFKQPAFSPRLYAGAINIGGKATMHGAMPLAADASWSKAGPAELMSKAWGRG